MINDLCFLPNITDAISFSYKKTIGPLKINNIKCNIVLKDLTLVIKNIINKIYIEKDSIHNYNELIYRIEHLLYELFSISNISLYTYINNFIINNEINDIESILIYMIKFIKNKNIDTFEDHFNNLNINQIL